jgi:putative Ca2+/H+ antiporter (TMEM165/GDT1 family)
MEQDSCGQSFVGHVTVWDEQVMMSALITVAKVRWPIFFGAVTGILISTVYRRIDQRIHPVLTWRDVSAAFVGVGVVFLIQCLWIWRKQNRAVRANA